MRCWLFLNFNSIKVQLEHTVAVVVLANTPFQFHKGTIRTQMKHTNGNELKNFNSIKVQLELWNTLVQREIHPQFQFHKGTIRTFNTKFLHSHFKHFNSIKVQLEPTDRH